MVKAEGDTMENFEVMRCYSGSLAYGTNLPTSDVDIRGLFCAPPNSFALRSLTSKSRR